MAALTGPAGSIELTEQERQIARDTSRKLAAHLADRELHLQVIPETGALGQPEQLSLPGSAVRLLAGLLSEMAQGNSVALLPVHTELTTQKAADLLNVSRPYLVTLLESGAIPYRVVGTHRRVRCGDVLEYKRRVDEEREKVLDQLTAEAQELNMGY